MTPQRHRKLVRRAKEDAALQPADAMAATALAQSCAVGIKGACLRYNVTVMHDPDGRYAMPFPVCFRCRCYLEGLWENDPDSDEAAVRIDAAVARTWERGAAIGAVTVTGEVTQPRPTAEDQFA